MANVRAMVPFTLTPISVAAPLSSETASMARPAFVYFINDVRAIMMTMQAKMVTMVSPEMVSAPSASLSGAIFTTEVKALVSAPKISIARFCSR